VPTPLALAGCAAAQSNLLSPIGGLPRIQNYCAIAGKVHSRKTEK